MHSADITIDLANNKVEYHASSSEPWKITLVDTGLETMTGGRIKRIQKYVDNEPFMLTYGDGVADININQLVDYHKQKGKLVTLTAVLPSGKFGALEIQGNDHVASFIEKPQGDGAWINGGFFVLQPEVFDYITEGDSTIFERKPLENLARDGQLQAYKYSGFWRCMDTLKDKIELEKMWEIGKAHWKVWNE
jgi:glucose-1-phosphate cytidylyltransferase